MSSDIRKKFGLDYLLTPKASLLDDRQIDLAVMTAGSKIVFTLKQVKNHSARLHDLVNMTGYELETLLPVVNRLESLKLVTYTERDKLGNHEISLTPTGMELPV